LDDTGRQTPYRYVGIRAHETAGVPPLAPFLTMRPPDDYPEIDKKALAEAPPLLSFNRKRTVDLPWRTIFEGVSIDPAPSLTAVRRMLERGWPLPEAPADTDYAALVSEGWIYATAAESADGAALPPVFRVTVDPNTGDPVGTAVTAGIVFRHASGRLYLALAAEPDAPLSLDSFKTCDGYEAAWANGIDGVEPVYATAALAAAGSTGFAEVDLRPTVIQQKLVELLEERRLSDRIGGQVEEMTDEIVRRIAATRLETGDIDEAQNRLIQARLGRFDVERRLDRLVSQAAAFGYHVFKDDKSFTFAPGDERPVKAGEVYTKFKRTAFWTTPHIRIQAYRQRVLWWTERRHRVVIETRQHSKTVADYQKVDTDVDLVGRRADAYRQQGMTVYVCARGPNGFVASDGQSLRAIMERCELDEAFRVKCVVFLPVYDERLTGERALIKYSIFERPLPGVQAVDLPRLSIVEQLSYRTAWRGVQLGELVSSINLAPGETRTVVVSKEYRQETTVTRSTTSIFEVNEAESNDLATEMENQFSRDSEEASYIDTDTTVSGSYGFITAEANVKAGASSSMREASQAISRVARKAAHSINRQQREEVTSSSSTKTTVTTRDQTTATLRNINDGRTLNLMFYRVYNRFDSALFLDDLKLDIIPGVEVIAGSGVFEAVTVPLADLDGLVAELNEDQLPFSLSPADAFRYRQHVIESINALLEAEYGRGDDDAGQGDMGAARFEGTRDGDAGERDDGDDPRSRSVRLIALPSRASAAKAPSRADADEIAELERRLAQKKAEQKQTLEAEIAFREELATAKTRFAGTDVLNGEPRQPVALRVASGGLYLDSLTGVQPSTEPYSEAMREQEVRLRAAEVFQRESDGVFLRAQAARLARMAPLGGDGNRLVGRYPNPDLTQLTLPTRVRLAGGRWRLLLDGAVLDDATVEVRETEAVVTFPEPQPWMMDADLAARLELVELESQERIAGV
jgi:hypothetical protein